MFEADHIVRRGNAFAEMFATRPVGDSVVVMFVVAAQGVAEIVA